MTKTKTHLLSASSNIMHARAISLRILLLEEVFNQASPGDEIFYHLILMELGTAYKNIMATPDSTKTLIKLYQAS